MDSTNVEFGPVTHNHSSTKDQDTNAEGREARIEMTIRRAKELARRWGRKDGRDVFFGNYGDCFETRIAYARAFKRG